MEMLSLIKHSLVADCTNPIVEHFRLVKHVANAGQEQVWKIYDSIRIKDGKEASVFLFEKKIADKLHKPKRREIVSDLLRRDVINLMRFRHNKILRVIHSLEECNDSLAFATEPVLASLSNLLGHRESLPSSAQHYLKINKKHYEDYSLLDTEIKYGILQIAEALFYLHGVERVVHLNISPQNIVITKKGMWKLTGFGLLQSIATEDSAKNMCTVQPWSPKNYKMAQSDLNYLAPEIQRGLIKVGAPSADMFSLGMLIIAAHNGGKPLFDAVYNPQLYTKQYDKMSELFSQISGRLPHDLIEPVEKMINKDTRCRPTAQQFIILKFFDDAVVHCMDNMDAIDTKDLSQKCEFFSLLPQAIPQFPRKLLFSAILPMLREQIDYQDMLVLVLPSFVALIEQATDDEYKSLLQADLKRILSTTKPIQATVYLLEKLPILLTKVSEEETRTEILPMIFTTLESNSIQGQEAAISVFSSIKKYLDDSTMRKLVLPKAKALFSKSTNVKTKLNSLECINRLLDSLDKMMILEDVLPFLAEMQCTDVDITMAVVSIYKHLMSDKRFGLTHNLLATKVMPHLLPLSVIPGLSLQQFTCLMELLRDMLDQIERQRLTKMANEIPDETELPNRRSSLDVRLKITLSSGSDSANPNRTLLNVNERYSSQSRQPSNPDILNHLTTESQTPKSYRRHSSFQGLGAAEQTVLENIVRQGQQQQLQQQQQQQQRRSSTVGIGQPQQLAVGGHPHIMVSEASMSDLKDQSGVFCSSAPTQRRNSATSIGPVIIPETGQHRDSFGRLAAQGPMSGRRNSSFQGMCDTAMQFFGGK